MKIKKIINPIFKTELAIIYNCDRKTANKYLVSIKEREMDEDDHCLGELIERDDGMGRVIWLKSFHKDNKTEVSIFIHELFHYVIRLCDNRGIPITARVRGYPGDEAAAYLMEFYFNEFIK